MNEMLRLTVTLSRLSRRRWTKAQAIVALAVLAIALAIGLTQKMGYWPAALTADRSHIRVPHVRL